MDDPVELVSDGDGLAIIGPENAVEHFINSMGLRALPQELDLDRLGAVFARGSELGEAASAISEKMGRYVKLSKESAERMHEVGLMPTKTRGISHAMLGDPGKINKWLQIEDGAGALLTNPALLSGAAGIMAQLARQQEAMELEELLGRLDEKLDDVRRRLRDEVLAKVDRVVDAIDEASVIREYGGDRQTAWEKMVSEAGILADIRGNALRALDAIADRMSSPSNVGPLSKSMTEIEQEVTLWLTVLARCFQLEDEYKHIELDHVMDTAPDTLERHRLALDTVLQERRTRVAEKTRLLVGVMEKAGGLAASNLLLHVRAARQVVNTANRVAASVEEFHLPLGIECDRDEISTPRLRDAFRDRQQLRNAADEIGPKLALAALGTTVAVATVLKRSSTNSSSNTEA